MAFKLEIVLVRVVAVATLINSSSHHGSLCLLMGHWIVDLAGVLPHGGSGTQAPLIFSATIIIKEFSKVAECKINLENSIM